MRHTSKEVPFYLVSPNSKDFILGSTIQRPQTRTVEVRVFLCLPSLASPTNLIVLMGAAYRWEVLFSTKTSKTWWMLCWGKLDLMFTQSPVEYMLLLWNICCQILMLETSSVSGFIKQHGENFASSIYLNIDVFIWTDVFVLPAQCVIRLEILQQQF